MSSYGLIIFVMTASPVAMVGHGHSADKAALGIQWHILAMYGPSFVTRRLMVRFGKERVAAVGLLLIGTSAVVALTGVDILHFWLALVLLGVGWNFGFLGATRWPPIVIRPLRVPRCREPMTSSFLVPLPAHPSSQDPCCTVQAGRQSTGSSSRAFRSRFRCSPGEAAVTQL